MAGTVPQRARKNQMVHNQWWILLLRNYHCWNFLGSNQPLANSPLTCKDVHEMYVPIRRLDQIYQEIDQFHFYTLVRLNALQSFSAPWKHQDGHRDGPAVQITPAAQHVETMTQREWWSLWGSLLKHQGPVIWIALSTKVASLFAIEIQITLMIESWEFLGHASAPVPWIRARLIAVRHVHRRHDSTALDHHPLIAFPSACLWIGLQTRRLPDHLRSRCQFRMDIVDYILFHK